MKVWVLELERSEGWQEGQLGKSHGSVAVRTYKAAPLF